MSEIEKNGLDELFRNGLSNAEVEPQMAWSQMESQLNAQKRRRKGAIWFWVSGLAAAIFLMVGSFYFFNEVQEKPMALLPNHAIKQGQSNRQSATPQDLTKEDNPAKLLENNTLETNSQEIKPKRQGGFNSSSPKNALVSNPSKLPFGNDSVKKENALAESVLKNEAHIPENQTSTLPTNLEEAIIVKSTEAVVPQVAEEEIEEEVVIEIRSSKRTEEPTNRGLNDRLKALVAKAKNFDRDSSIKALRTSINKGIVAMIK